MTKVIEGEGFKIQVDERIINAVLKTVHRDLFLLILEYRERRGPLAPLETP